MVPRSKRGIPTAMRTGLTSMTSLEGGKYASELSTRLYGAAWEKGTRNRVPLGYGCGSRGSRRVRIRPAGVQREVDILVEPLGGSFLGSRRLYLSSVIVTEEWPRRSDTTFGCTPALRRKQRGCVSNRSYMLLHQKFRRFSSTFQPGFTGRESRMQHLGIPLDSKLADQIV